MPVEEQFGLWDYGVFFSMLLASSGIGIYYAFTSARKPQVPKSMGVVPVAMSLISTSLSPVAMLGIPAEMYFFGIQFIVIQLGLLVTVLLTNHVYMPMFYNLDVASAFQYLELRFSRTLRTICSVSSTLQMVVYMAIVLYGPALALQQVTGVNLWLSVLSIGAVCTFYTSIGGIKAIVMADVFMSFIKYASIVLLAVKGTLDVGGPAIVFQKNLSTGRLQLLDFRPDPTVRHSVWAMVIGGSFLWLTLYAVNQSWVQRYLSMRSVQAVRRQVKNPALALWVNLFGVVVLQSLLCYVGLVIFAAYSDCDPISTRQVTAADQLVPLHVMDIFGSYPGVPGLIVSGIFSGGLSGVSASLASLATTTLQDIIKTYIRPDLGVRASAITLQILTIAFGVIVVVMVYVAQQMGDVLQAALSVLGIVGGPLVGVFTLGIFVPFANALGAIVGMVTAMVALSWITVGAFIRRPMHPRPSVSVDGCTDLYLNVTGFEHATLPTADVDAHKLYIYRLSYLWYSLLGVVIVLVLGSVVSIVSAAEAQTDLSLTCRRCHVPLLPTFCLFLVVHGRPSFRCIDSHDQFDLLRRTSLQQAFNSHTLIYSAFILFYIYSITISGSMPSGPGVWNALLRCELICCFYPTAGGIKAVVWTDVFQIFLMFASMLLVAVKGAYNIGGFGYVFELASENKRVEFFNFNIDPTDRHTVWGLTIGCYFTWMSIYAVSQAMVQRYLTLPNLRGARRAIWFNLPGLSFLLIICALAGLVMFAKYYDCDPLLTKKVNSSDQLLPLYVMDILGTFPGIPGLFVSGIFSGALSTVSSGVNSLAAVTLEDVIKRHIKSDMSDRFATNLTKGLAMSYGFIAILLVYIAQQLGNVLQAALSIFGIVGGPLLGVFTLGIFFPFANTIGAGAGIICSLVTLFWIGFGSFYYKPAVHKAPVSIMGCLQLYLNVTGQRGNVTLPVPVDVEAANANIMWIYRISYVWYSMIGCGLVVIFGIIVSFVTGFTRPSDVNPRTVNPLYNFLCRKLLPKALHDKVLVRSIEEYDKEQMIALGRSRPLGQAAESGEGKVNPAFVANDDKELAVISPAMTAANIPATTFDGPRISERRQSDKQSPGGDTVMAVRNGMPQVVRPLSKDEAATPL
ncbi:unnamed protein product [Ixodes hexagonus]